jgi:hypothetical protein
MQTPGSEVVRGRWGRSAAYGSLSEPLAVCDVAVFGAVRRSPAVPTAWSKVAELATLPSVNPTIGAALIALAGAIVVAYFGASFTAAKTIKADQHRRVWEKRSEAYTDAVAGILQLVKVRYSRMQQMTTETEPEDPLAPTDPSLVEARLIAYASDDVLKAMEQAKLHGSRFDAAFRMWLAAYAQAHVATPPPPPVDPVTAQDIGDPMETAKKELPEATMLCNNVMDIIRKELYAGPGRMQPPRRRQDLSKMAPGRRRHLMIFTGHASARQSGPYSRSHAAATPCLQTTGGAVSESH